MDDCHFKYIIKMKKNIVGPWFALFVFQCFDVKSLMIFLAKKLVEFTLKNKNFPTFWLQKQQYLSQKIRSSQ
jgi:hypothetical protein